LNRIHKFAVEHPRIVMIQIQDIVCEQRVRIRINSVAFCLRMPDGKPIYLA
jgi:hypothetical protein